MSKSRQNSTSVDEKKSDSKRSESIRPAFLVDDKMKEIARIVREIMIKHEQDDIRDARLTQAGA